jgi:CII-binding regulator of phage lambda lysogenization HflD
MQASPRVDAAHNLARVLRQHQELRKKRELEIDSDDEYDDESPPTPLILKLFYPLFLLGWIMFQGVMFIVRITKLFVSYFVIYPAQIVLSIPFLLFDFFQMLYEDMPKTTIIMLPIVASTAWIYAYQPEYVQLSLNGIKNWAPEWKLFQPFPLDQQPIGAPASTHDNLEQEPNVASASSNDYLNTLESLQQHIGSLEAKFKQYQQSIEETAQKFASLEQDNAEFKLEQNTFVSTLAGVKIDVENVFESVNELSSQIKSTTQKSPPPHQSLLTQLSSQVETAALQIQHIDDVLRGLQLNYSTIQQSLSDMSSAVVDIEANISNLQEEVKELTNEEKLAKKLTTVMDEVLPEYLLVQKNPINGQVELSPDLYNYLSSLFVREQRLKEVLDDKVLSTTSVDPEVLKNMSVEIFKENAYLLKDILAEDEPNITESSSLKRVSKETVLSLLENEFLAAQVVLESTHRRNDGNGDIASPPPSQVLVHVIDSALSRYSADRVGLPDFALHSAGAQVVPSNTTPTYTRTPGSFGGLILYKTFGLGGIKGKPPSIALNEDNSIGSCWAFSGNEGTLTVRLAKSVVVTDFTIEHIDPRVAFDLTTAPKDIEVWGFVSKESDQVPEEMKEEQFVLLASYQ